MAGGQTRFPALQLYHGGNMLTPDENLIRAVERFIDGGVGHHYYSTIAMYKTAANAGDAKTFADKEQMLRSWVLFRTRELMPKSYQAAIQAICDKVNTDGAPCPDCGRRRVHDQQCRGTKGRAGGEPCWTIRNPCEGLDGRCCHCHAKMEVK